MLLGHIGRVVILTLKTKQLKGTLGLDIGCIYFVSVVYYTMFYLFGISIFAVDEIDMRLLSFACFSAAFMSVFVFNDLSRLLGSTFSSFFAVYTLLMVIASFIAVSIFVFGLTVTETSQIAGGFFFIAFGVLLVGAASGVLPMLHDGINYGIFGAWKNANKFIKQLFLPAPNSTSGDEPRHNSTWWWEEGKRKRDAIKRWMRKRRTKTKGKLIGNPGSNAAGIRRRSL